MTARGSATPIALLILAACAAAYLAFFDERRASDADRLARRDRLLPTMRIEDVTRVRLDRGGRSLVIERQAGAADGGAPAGPWTITSPRRERADAAAVDVLLRQLELARRLRSVAGAPGLGLDAPRAAGAIDVGPVEVRFALGGDAPRPQGAAYLRVEGEGTFVVEEALKEQLLRGDDAYRDRTLAPYGASAVLAVELRDAAGATTAIERSGATFRFRGGLRVARAAVERLLSALSDARLDSFLDDAAADAATARPTLSVTIAPRDASQPRVAFRLGDPCLDAPGTVAVVRSAPSRVSGCLPQAVVEALAPGLLASDASPFFAHADEIEEVRLEPVGVPGPTVEIARKGAGWRERAPEERDLTADEGVSAGALVDALAAAAATSVRAGRDGERVEARARVTIVRTGTSTAETVELAAPGADGSAEARRADDGAILSLPRAAARRFTPHPVALRGRDVWRTPPDPGAVVGVLDSCGPTPLAADLRQGRWVPRAPSRASPDAAAVTDVIAAAARVRADAWIAEADDGGFGFGGPGSCVLRLTLAPSTGQAGVRVAWIELGAAAYGGVYARTVDDPAVLVAPEALRRALAAAASPAP